MKFKFTLFLMFLICFTIHARGRRQPPDHTKVFTQIIEKLDLSDDKKTKVNEIITKYKKEFEALRPEKGEHKPGEQGERPDMESMREKMETMKKKMDSIMTKMKNEIKEVLSEQEYEAFEKAIQNLMKQRHQRRKQNSGNF